MYTPTTSSRKSIIPFWSEIRKMSWEERNRLAELIESSLEEDDEADRQMETFADKLDNAAMQAAADFAYTESKAGQTIPHSQILTEVKEGLGWK